MVPLYQNMQFTIKQRVIHAKVWGPPDGHPVIALHGWLDNAASFDVIACHLFNVRLVALDLAGHGLSQHRAEASYELWCDMADIMAVAAQLEWEQLGLLGHSRGAIIATLLAGTFPDIISHAGLIDAIFPDVVSAEQAPIQLGKAILADNVVSTKPRTVYKTLDQTALVRQAGIIKTSHTVARRLVERGTQGVKGGYSWNTDPRLLLPSPWKCTEQQLAAFMRRIRVPMPLIVASRGLAQWDETWKEQLQPYPNARIHEMDGSHHLHMEGASQATGTIMTDYYNQ